MFSWRKLLSRLTEIGLYFLLLMMILVVIIVLYVLPSALKPAVTVVAVVLMAVTLGSISFLALMHRLEFRMGFRNLIRHKGDTVIAILGFMIGTSIICSSMAIGDTLSTMVEGLVYDGYHLYDEYIAFPDAQGNYITVNGTFADDMADIAEELDRERDLIDGISWEYEKSGSVVNFNTSLFEPGLTLRTFNWGTADSFGGLFADGKEVGYDLGYDEVYIVKDGAEKLEAQPGHTLRISSGERDRNFTVRAVLDQTGRANSQDGSSIYFSMPALWDLFNESYSEGPRGDGGNWTGGAYNVLGISNNGGRVEGAEHCEEVVSELEKRWNEELDHPLGREREFEFTGNKADDVEQSTQSMQTFTQLFLTFGTFTIIAGITLIINIFVMLSEERKEEMGITRAVGMKRKELRLVYLFEGTFYSLISSLVGVFLGVLAGYLIIVAMQSIFSSMGVEGWNVMESYTVTPLSMILAFVAGFTITIATTLFITSRVSRLNIVSAIRNTPVPRKRPRLVTMAQKVCGVYDIRTCSGDDSPLARALSFLFDRMTLLGFFSLFIGVMSLLIGTAAKQFAPTFLGLSLLMVGIALVLKYFLNNRLTYSLMAVLLLVLWIVDIPFFNDYTGGIEMFILSGIFMVSAAVMLLIWNTDLILWVVERIVLLVGASPASIKMAISYPVKKRFRTGVTIFMFSLIIFTITGMFMISNTFMINIDAFEETLGGGYDVIGISQTGVDDLESSVIKGEQNPLFDIEVSDKVDWENTVSLSIGFLRLNMSMEMYGQVFEEEVPYQCAGINDKFIEKNSYGFSKVDWDLVYEGGEGPREDEDVWQAVKDDPDLIIMDSTLSGDNSFVMATNMVLDAGDELELISFNGTRVKKTVIAFTEQQGINAIFMYNGTAEEEFGVTEERVHLFRIEEGEDTREVANDLRRSLIFYGLYTIIVRELIEEVLETQNAFFDLLNAFLALGLVIGVIGLGIVTLRSVYERRHEIGMMRAIGFKRNSVVMTFLGESAFIAGSGLFLGMVLGILLGWILWKDDLGDLLPEFGIPWVKILVVIGIAFFFAVASSIPPSFRASRVTPADALRYE